MQEDTNAGERREDDNAGERRLVGAPFQRSLVLSSSCILALEWPCRTEFWACRRKMVVSPGVLSS